MRPTSALKPGHFSDVVLATGEAPIFAVGDSVRVLDRSPVGHYRVPTYLRGKPGRVEAIIPRLGLNNEEEGFGRNAGQKLHYYRITVPMVDIWPGYPRRLRDSLHIEVFETWLERM